MPEKSREGAPDRQRVSPVAQIGMVIGLFAMVLAFCAWFLMRQDTMAQTLRTEAQQSQSQCAPRVYMEQVSSRLDGIDNRLGRIEQMFLKLPTPPR